MASDAHSHPWDLRGLFPGAEKERRKLGVSAAASAWNQEQFEYHEELSKKALAEGEAPLALCFGVHPQLSARKSGKETESGRVFLEKLAAEKRLHAVGEAGFDLYSGEFKEKEAAQEEIFDIQLETALAHDLPLVLHIRKAMNKVFAREARLKRLPALVFHSYSGTLEEGRSLLKRGINAYFSFGAAITLNHQRAMECCGRLPADRLLFETDSPYQSPRGKPYSSWADYRLICGEAARLRKEAASPLASYEELEARTDRNFKNVFGV